MFYLEILSHIPLDFFFLSIVSWDAGQPGSSAKTISCQVPDVYMTYNQERSSRSLCLQPVYRPSRSAMTWDKLAAQWMWCTATGPENPPWWEDWQFSFSFSCCPLESVEHVNVNAIAWGRCLANFIRNKSHVGPVRVFENENSNSFSFSN